MGAGDFLASFFGLNSQYQPNANQVGNAYGPSMLQYDINNQGNIYNQQQALAGQLQQQALGQGPNPAQNMYQQNVGQNIANAQGQISSQRGLNPALAAKLGANAGAQMNQQGAANSALLQQTQQLGAQQNLGTLLGQEQQGNIAAQQNYIGSNTSAMQTNAAVANANQQAAQGAFGSTVGAVGSFAGMGGAATAATPKAEGGIIEDSYSQGGMTHYDDGGFVNTAQPSVMSRIGQSLSQEGQGISQGYGSSGNGNRVLTQGFGVNGAMGANNQPMAAGMQQFGKSAGLNMSRLNDYLSTRMNGNSITGGYVPTGAEGDALPAVEDSSLPEVAAMAHRGGQISKNPKNFKPGGYVPGKASVKGDSLKNDTVPAMVSPGEIVIPRSVAQHPDAARKSAAFVAAVLAKQGMKKR